MNRLEFADFVQRLRAAGYAGRDASGGIGRFFHHGWEVGRVDDPLLARIAGFHEFGHAALNSTTAWGGLLQFLDIYLGVESVADRRTRATPWGEG